jgi:hypothetical protein
MGTHLKFFFGGNFTGKPFVSAFIRGRQSQTYIDMCSILQDRQPPPRRGLASFVQNREHITTERLFLPLGGSSEDPRLRSFVGTFIRSFLRSSRPFSAGPFSRAASMGRVPGGAALRSIDQGHDLG